jgi:hypothetical protein
MHIQSKRQVLYEIPSRRRVGGDFDGGRQPGASNKMATTTTWSMRGIPERILVVIVG